MSDLKDNATPGDPSFLTVDQAAALLKVDRKTVYGAIKAGQVPEVLRLLLACSLGPWDGAGR